jgi:hypothetical protein
VKDKQQIVQVAKITLLEYNLLNVFAKKAITASKIIQFVNIVIPNANHVLTLQATVQAARMNPIERILLNVIVKLDILKARQNRIVSNVIKNVKIVNGRQITALVAKLTQRIFNFLRVLVKQDILKMLKIVQFVIINVWLAMALQIIVQIV